MADVAKGPTKPTARKGRRSTARPSWVPGFLDALRRTGTVYHACLEAKIHRSTMYERLKKDSAFAADYAAAMEDANDVLEREAFRRGAEGYDEPIVYKGAIMGEHRLPDGTVCEAGAPGAVFVPLTVRKYSDRLLSNLLRWRRYPDPKAPGEDDEPPLYDRQE